MKPKSFLDQLFWLCIFPGFLIAVVYPLRMDGYLNPYDDGLWLGAAQALLEGKALYKEVFFHYGPLLGLYLQAAVRFLPATLSALRGSFWALNTAGLLCIYFCLLRWVASPAVRLSTSIFLWIIPLTSQISTIPMGARYSAGFLPLLFWLAPWETPEREKIFSFFSGAFAAVAFFISQEVGLAALCAGLYYHALGLHAKKRRIPFLAGALSVFALGAGWLLMNHTWMPYIDCCFIQTSQIVASERLPVPTLIMKSWNHRGPWFVPFQAWGATLSLYLPALTYVMLLVSAAWHKVRGKAYDRAITALALYGLLVGVHAWVHPDRWHIYFALSPALFLWAIQADRAAGRKNETGILWAALVGAILTLPHYTAFLAKDRVFRSHSRPARIERAGTARLPIPQVDGYEFLVGWIHSHTKSGEGILFYPYDGAIYFLSNRPNPTYYPVLILAATPYMQEKVLRELDSNPPKWVIWDEEDTAFLGRPIADCLSLIQPYIRAHYRVRQKVGPFIFLRRAPAGTI